MQADVDYRNDELRTHIASTEVSANGMGQKRSMGELGPDDPCLMGGPELVAQRAEMPSGGKTWTDVGRSNPGSSAENGNG